MSYNGSGVWTANSTGLPVVTGTTISSVMFNAFTADVATGLSTAVCKDGQQTCTQRVPFVDGISTFGVNLEGSAGSGQIGFIQSFANSTARTVQAKARDWVSVKDFGIVGNGSTDETTKMQNALASGENLIWPQGCNVLVTAALQSYGQRLTADCRFQNGGTGITWNVAVSGNTSLLYPNTDGLPLEADHLAFNISSSSTFSSNPQIIIVDALGSRFNRFVACMFNGQNVALTNPSYYTGIRSKKNGSVKPYDQWVKDCIFNNCDYDLYLDGGAGGLDQCIGYMISGNEFSLPRDTFANVKIIDGNAIYFNRNLFNATGVSGGSGAYAADISGASTAIDFRQNYYDGGPNGKNRINIGSSATRILVDELMIGSTEVVNLAQEELSVYDHDVKTWSPVLYGLTSGIGVTNTYTAQSGFYQREGQMLHVWGYVAVNAKGALSGNTALSLPFAARNSSSVPQSATLDVVDQIALNTNATGSTALYIPQGQIYGELLQSDTRTTGAADFVSDAKLGANPGIRFNFRYQVRY